MPTSATSCAVCRSDDSAPKYPGIVTCRSCGYVYADLDVAVLKSLSGLYDRNYFAGEEYRDYLEERAIIQRNFDLRLKRLLRFVHEERRSSMLEIGCAYGFFMDRARHHFDRLVGYDVSDEATAHACKRLGLDVRCADVIDAELPEKFDVVCMWDTIEHLAFPDRVMDKIADVTKPGSIVAITTGDIDSVNASVKKGRWRLIHPPTHAHYFSRETLTRLVTDRGFEVIDFSYAGSYRSVDSAAHFVLALQWKKPALYEKLHRTGLLDVNVYSNLRDIQYLIAKKT